MRFNSILFGIVICWAGFSCKSGAGDSANKYTGTIEPAGITSYQYGTHRLEAKDTFYALRSKKLDLSQFEGQQVTISATPIEGYPVDGGPGYLEVNSVEN